MAHADQRPVARRRSAFAPALLLLAIVAHSRSAPAQTVDAAIDSGCRLSMLSSARQIDESRTMVLLVTNSLCAPCRVMERELTELACKYGIEDTVAMVPDRLVASSTVPEVRVVQGGRILDRAFGIAMRRTSQARRRNQAALRHLLARNGILPGLLSELEGLRLKVSAQTVLRQGEGITVNFAILDGADLRGLHGRGAVLSAVSLKGARLDDADLRGAFLSHVDLTGATLTGARLGRAIATKVVCPDGEVISGPLVCAPFGESERAHLMDAPHSERDVMIDAEAPHMIFRP
jgi:hypothetical protein